MKNLKKITSLLLVFALIVACLGLVSCGDSNKCNHEWGEWTVRSERSCTHDGVKVRSCALCAEIEKVTEPATGHSDDDICTVCGALTLEITPTFEKVNSALFKVKDVEIIAVSENLTGTVDLAELYLAMEGGQLTGYGHGTLILSAASQDSASAVSAKVYIEGAMLYYEAEGLESLGVGATEDSVYGSLNIVEFITENMGSAGSDDAGIGGDISASDIADIIGNISTTDIENISEMYDEILEWAKNELAPIFSDVTFDSNMAKIEAIVTKGITNLLKIEKVDGGKTVSIDLSKLKDWNKDLQTKTIAELVDLLLGEDAFDGIKDSVDDILAYTVSDFLTYLRTVQGIKIEKLLEALDKLAVIITDDEEADFESLIGAEGDFAEKLTDEEFLNYSIGDALMEVMGVSSVEEAASTIKIILTTYGQVTIYDMMMADATETGAMVDQMIDMIDSMVSFVITVDDDGKFVKEEISLEIFADITGSVSVSITETITNSGYVVTVAMSDAEGNSLEATAEAVLGYESTADMTEYLAIKTKCENAKA